MDGNQPIPPPGWLVLTALLSGAVYWFVSHPSHLLPAAVATVACGLWVRITAVAEARRFDRMARERSGESICQFARHFRGPEFDPVVVRAVYEMTQEEIGRSDLPIRPSDSLHQEYGIEDEDLDDLAAGVAEIARRSLEVIYRNPYTPVRTVADLVRFLQSQPRLPA